MKDLLITINIHAGPVRINRLRFRMAIDAVAVPLLEMAIARTKWPRWIQAEIVEQ